MSTPRDLGPPKPLLLQLLDPSLGEAHSPETHPDLGADMSTVTSAEQRSNWLQMASIRDFTHAAHAPGGGCACDLTPEDCIHTYEVHID